MSPLQPTARARSRHIVSSAVLAAFAAVALGTLAGTAAAQTSTELRVGGAVQTPRTYDYAGLAALPAVDQTVTFASGTTPQTHDYTGTPLWSLVNSAGVQTDPSVKNDILNKLVLATGSDGYRAVYSMGELSPDFGNRGSLVAYAETVAGTTAPLGADGFARTTAPGDVRGGRYVSNLVSLDVLDSGSTAQGVGGGSSTQFSVSGDVLHGGTFDLASLQALPQTSVTVGSDLFSGVSFWDFLNTTIGLATDPAVKNDVLDMYVVATGSDGYRSVFSLGELDPLFGNAPDLIALSANGGDLGANGFARIVAPDDIKHGRWVSNLTSLEVLHAAPVPEPQTWALLLGGLAALGFVRRRANHAA